MHFISIKDVLTVFKTVRTSFIKKYFYLGVGQNYFAAHISISNLISSNPKAFT